MHPPPDDQTRPWSLCGVALHPLDEAEVRAAVAIAVAVWMLMLLAMWATHGLTGERAALSLGAALAGAISSALGIELTKGWRHLAAFAVIWSATDAAATALRLLAQM